MTGPTQDLLRRSRGDPWRRGLVCSDVAGVADTRRRVAVGLSNGSDRVSRNPGHILWSSSPVVGETQLGWVVNFMQGNTGFYNLSYKTYVRCVR